MKANGRGILLALGIIVVVIGLLLVLYENYQYFPFIGLFLLFLVIIYLASSITS